MTRQVLFMQGGGEGAHDERDEKLVAGLERELGRGYELRYPRMPNEADPRYGTWSRAIAKEIDALEDGAIVVGHSVGGTLLIRTLADKPLPRKLNGVVLIAAPFVGEGGWPDDDIAAMDHLGGQLPSGMRVRLFHGGADETAPPAHAD